MEHENKLLRAEIKDLENSTSKRSKEVIALADDLVNQEKLCENMEQELAKLLQKEKRGRRERRTTMAKKWKSISHLISGQYIQPTSLS